MGFVLAPRALVNDVAAAIRINCWSTGPLAALVASAMIEGGTTSAVIEKQKQELRRRQAVIRELLAGFDMQTHDTSTHAWLHLPEPWRTSSFTRHCLRRGVAVPAAEAFVVSRDVAPPHAVRINVSAARSLDDLRKALEIVTESSPATICTSTTSPDEPPASARPAHGGRETLVGTRTEFGFDRNGSNLARQEAQDIDDDARRRERSQARSRAPA